MRKCLAAWPAHRRADLVGLLKIRSQQFIRDYPAKVAALDLLIGQLSVLDEEDPE